MAVLKRRLRGGKLFVSPKKFGLSKSLPFCLIALNCCQAFFYGRQSLRLTVDGRSFHSLDGQYYFEPSSE